MAATGGDFDHVGQVRMEPLESALRSFGVEGPGRHVVGDERLPHRPPGVAADPHVQPGAPHRCAGKQMIAPFGKQTVQGVVFRFIDQPSVSQVKEIIEIVDAAPVITQAQIALADAMSESTFSSLTSIVSLFLPAGLSQEADTSYAIREQQLEKQRSNIESSSIASRIVKLIQERGPIRGRQLDSHFSKVDWRKVAISLVRKGVLESKSVLPPARVRSKYIKTAQLAVAPEILETQIDHLGKTESTQTRRKKALQFLMQVKDAVNVSWVYAESGSNLADLQELEERGLRANVDRLSSDEIREGLAIRTGPGAGNEVERGELDAGGLGDDPHRDRASRRGRTRRGRSATSVATASTSRPSRRMSSQTDCSSVSLRDASTTRAPREDARRAVASPIPLEAPVITITCSFRAFRR